MAILLPYDQETQRMLANPPPAGQNRHEWLFRVQARLYRIGGQPGAIIERLTQACLALGWTDRAPELAGNMAKIVAQAAQPAPQTPRHGARRPDWPAPCHEARQALYGTPALFDTSPKPVTATDVLTTLFPPGAWICAAHDVYRAQTMPLDALLPGAPTYAFVVPNAMQAEYGLTGTGTKSQRAKANACPPSRRRFMVVEFDTHDTPTEQVAVLSWLHSADTPLCLAVWSGGKSIHGWYNVAGLPSWQKARFFWLAAYLGADASLWDTSKLVRMPGGRRDTGQTQDVLFWEPEHA